MPILLQVPQEREHALEVEILDLQTADGMPRVVRDERQEQPNGVAVTANRALAQALLRTEIVEKEVVHEGAHGEVTHDRTSRRTGLANASKRWLAASRSSLVIVRYTAVL